MNVKKILRNLKFHSSIYLYTLFQYNFDCIKNGVLPGQVKVMLHDLVSDSFPLHGFPSPRCAGFVQNLVLFCSPTPQVRLQLLQLLQIVKLPSTKENEFSIGESNSLTLYSTNVNL